MERKETLRYGVIGIGNIGYVHASSIAAGLVQGAVLAALCDCNEEMVPEIQKAFPEPERMHI